MKAFISIFRIFPIIICLTGCGHFLDDKPDVKLTEATTLADLEALLNNTRVMNYHTMGLGETSADNYYVDLSVWQSLEQHEREMYIWGDEIFYEHYLNPWLDYYQVVYYSNHVLSSLEKMTDIPANNRILYNQVKGKALFYRAYGFFKLVTLFSKTYDGETSETDLGIPLRLTDDFNIKSKRPSVSDCYAQILDDLETAKNLLPEYSANLHSPSKNACLVLLSWTTLIMQDFKKSAEYAAESLLIKDDLLDYGSFSASARYPFQLNNSETIFIVANVNNILGYWNAKIDTLLLKQYKDGDLRRELFFNKNNDNSSYFKGSYTGSNGLFMGLTTVDSYLNAAESLIRLDRVEEGLANLESLLQMRYTQEQLPDLRSLTKSEALSHVLEERRKEFVMRDSRWIDIKRLNKFEESKTTLKRNLNGELFQLLPNDNKYALPLPQQIIEVTGLPQNPR